MSVPAQPQCEEQMISDEESDGQETFVKPPGFGKENLTSNVGARQVNGNLSEYTRKYSPTRPEKSSVSGLLPQTFAEQMMEKGSDPTTLKNPRNYKFLPPTATKAIEKSGKETSYSRHVQSSIPLS